MESYKDKELMQRLYDELGTGKKVAEALGCNEKTVFAWFKSSM
ncbi:helix-turn-helix domain-containing protein [Priestia megaterium]